MIATRLTAPERRERFLTMTASARLEHYRRVHEFRPLTPLEMAAVENLLDLRHRERARRRRARIQGVYR